MNHTLIINLAIILLVAFVTWITGDALVLLALLLLPSLPYNLAVAKMQLDAMDGDEEDEEPKIGFNAKL